MENAISLEDTSRFSISSLAMSLAVYSMIALWTVAGIVFFVPLFACFKGITRWRNDRIMRLFIWLYGKGWLALMSPFVRFERVGFDEFDLEPPYVIVVNHRSFFDTYCMALLPLHDIAFAVRAWPFKMFWYAPFMRLAGYINVESGDWTQTVSAGRQILAGGGSVLFFPEGHRSRDGRLQRFFSGPFKLACETGARILPLCITGTDRLLPPGSWLMRPTTIRLEALAPIDPACFEGSEAHMGLRKHTKGVMADTISRVLREG
ncbi:MAG: 1-acyl-sn-glycerol-3-phosphate acyltransferase [Syntrophorhabdus sp.]|nr:1-acyl-sn-glycerol-3-phosphate acyltransferase [Syntrophorhabdus sp.]